jgi:hypothetical protein
MDLYISFCGRRQESLPDDFEKPAEPAGKDSCRREYLHIFLLDITHFIELTINGIDMLGKAGWVVRWKHV